MPPEGFEQKWRQWLHQGAVLDEVIPAAQTTIDQNGIAQAMRSAAAAPATQPADPIEICFRPDPAVWDGSMSNNGWLQELPKPITKLTWDNAACISPAMAQRLNLSRDDVVRLTYAGRSLEMPVLIVPGHADHAVTVALGYGRTRAGQVGNGCGFNTYSLRTSDRPWIAPGATIQRTGRTYALATTQEHFNMEGRDLARTVALQELSAPAHPGARRLPLSMFNPMA